MKTHKRPQRQKNPNVRRVQELRRSNAAMPIPSNTEYKRNLKHGLVWDDEEDDDLSAFTWR